jgi:hypothetical protein
MPNAYPYAYHSVHADPAHWGVKASPNIRAALFWAPLERFSVAKRNLPEDHLLIPWIAGYLPWQGYPYEAPPARDMRALLKHMRLRGADGYYTLISGMEELPEWWTGLAPPTYRQYSYDQYRLDMLQAWTSLDRFFSNAQPPHPLNIKTDKTRGVQMSGVVYGKRFNRVLLLISNHQKSAARVHLPRINGLPRYVDVPCSDSGKEHFQKAYVVESVNVNNLPVWRNHKPGDVNGDFKVNNRDLQMVVESYGACPSPRCFVACPADLNFDGVINTNDLLMVLNNWD